jgi:DNA polymerase III sliding clamp (beta) subunit (PCNA family)
MTVTATKIIQFNDLMKVFTKFVGKSESRPVLKNVYFDGKYFYGTDATKLLRVNAEYVSDIPEHNTDTFLFNPKENTFANIISNYPDCSRLIPIDYNSTVTIDGNIKNLHKHVKEIKKVVKKDRNHVMKMEFTNNETKVIAKNETDNYSATINNMWADGEEIMLHLSANYLIDAIEAIKKLSKVSYNKVELGLVSHLRPMNFYQENVFDIIILPVRSY